jgi:hypothetical protein
MRAVYRMIVLTGSLVCGAAGADGGLTVSMDQSPWPRWQARVGVAASPMVRSDLADSGQLLQSANLLGDYYFSGPGFGNGEVSGGFRATSGVMFGRHALLLGLPPAGTPRALSLGVSRYSAASNGLPEPSEQARTSPYLGVGYTGLSARGGWGFSADIGLLAVNPGSGLKVNAVGSQTARSADEVMSDWKLTPWLQLGVSYSF